MSDDPAVQAAEEAIKGVIGFGWVILPERRALATAAVEAARPIQVAPLIRQIEHMANISHQAHHRSAGKGAATVGWRECSLPFCADAHTVVRAAVRTEPENG